MLENRRYYYLKLKESFYNSETMVVLESMPDGILYSNLLMKMYLMSLKDNGILMLNDHIPHTPQTIAAYTRHQIDTVERALRVFIELGLVEILTDGAYYMCDIQLLIGQSSTEGERKKQARVRLQLKNLLPPASVDTCPPNDAVDKCPPILELERVRYRERERVRYRERERVRKGTTRPPLRTVSKCLAIGYRIIRVASRFANGLSDLHRKTIRVHGILRQAVQEPCRDHPALGGGGRKAKRHPGLQFQGG